MLIIDDIKNEYFELSCIGESFVDGRTKYAKEKQLKRFTRTGLLKLFLDFGKSKIEMRYHVYFNDTSEVIEALRDVYKGKDIKDCENIYVIRW